MRKNLLVLLLLISFDSGISQINPDWAARYNGLANNSDIAYVSTRDRYGNIYVGGESEGQGTNYDMTTVKVDPMGNILWSQRFNGLANWDDRINAMTNDDTGNVYVTGYTTGTGSSKDITTIKYGPDGTQKWAVTFWNSISGGSDVALCIKLDINGNVFVGGYLASPSGTDGTVIKYSPSGTELWHKRINGTSNLSDEISSLCADELGNIYAAGFVRNTVTDEDYALIKYDNNGNILWEKYYDGGIAFGQDFSSFITIDNSDNIIITGRIEASQQTQDIMTIKYTPLGNLIWERRYNLGDSEIGKMIVTDNLDNIYVGGERYGSTTYNDILLVKYDSSGSFKWVKVFDDTIAGKSTNDYFSSMCTDRYQDVYLTGRSEQSWVPFDPPDLITLKYNYPGNQMLKIQYNSPADNWDEGVGIHVDSAFNIYTSGTSIGSFSSYDYIVIKHSQPNTSIQNQIYLPTVFSLHQNYPNPFNPSTSIRFDLPKQGFVSLRVFDISGREVTELVKKELQPGVYEYNFDGSGLGSGVYFYRIAVHTDKLQSGDFTETRRMVLVK
jgi:hypothetical protein